MRNVLLLLFILTMTFELFAQEVPAIGRSPQALLMGDAFTAVADDDYTLFYNPAVLGRNKSVSLNPINVTVGGTNAISDTDRFKNFPQSDPAAIANRILNYPVNFQAATFPGFKMGTFGFNLFASSQTNMILKNAIHPILDIDYRYDRGFIAGYAYNIGGGAFSTRIKKTNKQKLTSGKRFSVGLSVKNVGREGMNDQYDLFGTTLLNKINSGSTEINDLKKALGYSKGKAWGVDMGAEYGISSGRSLLTAGLSILDVGNTQFRKTEGTGDVPRQEMTLNSGVAFKEDLGLIDYTLAADIRPLNSSIDMASKIHLGAELSLPLVTLNAGWNAGYLSYGGSVKLWPVKVTAGFYGIEVGSEFRQQEAKRFVLYVSLFDFSIDI